MLRFRSDDCDIRMWYIKMTSDGAFDGELSGEQKVVEQKIKELVVNSKRDKKKRKVNCVVLEMYEEMLKSDEEGDIDETGQDDPTESDVTEGKVDTKTETGTSNKETERTESDSDTDVSESYTDDDISQQNDENDTGSVSTSTKETESDTHGQDLVHEFNQDDNTDEKSNDIEKETVHEDPSDDTEKDETETDETELLSNEDDIIEEIPMPKQEVSYDKEEFDDINETTDGVDDTVSNDEQVEKSNETEHNKTDKVNDENADIDQDSNENKRKEIGDTISDISNGESTNKGDTMYMDNHVSIEENENQEDEENTKHEDRSDEIHTEKVNQDIESSNTRDILTEGSVSSDNTETKVHTPESKTKLNNKRKRRQQRSKYFRTIRTCGRQHSYALDIFDKMTHNLGNVTLFNENTVETMSRTNITNANASVVNTTLRITHVNLVCSPASLLMKYSDNTSCSPGPNRNEQKHVKLKKTQETDEHSTRESVSGNDIESKLSNKVDPEKETIQDTVLTQENLHFNEKNSALDARSSASSVSSDKDEAENKTLKSDSTVASSHEQETEQEKDRPKEPEIHTEQPLSDNSKPSTIVSDQPPADTPKQPTIASDQLPTEKSKQPTSVPDHKVEFDKLQLNFDEFQEQVTSKTESYSTKLQNLEMMVIRLENQLLVEKLNKQNHSSTITTLENHILKLENEVLKLNHSYSEINRKSDSIVEDRKKYLELGHDTQQKSTYGYSSSSGQNQAVSVDHQARVAYLSKLLNNQSSTIKQLKTRSDFLEDQNRLLYYMIMNQTALMTQIMSRVQELTEQNIQQRMEAQQIRQQMERLVDKGTGTTDNYLLDRLQEMVSDVQKNKVDDDEFETFKQVKSASSTSSSKKQSEKELEKYMQGLEVGKWCNTSTRICVKGVIVQFVCVPYSAFHWTRCSVKENVKTTQRLPKVTNSDGDTISRVANLESTVNSAATDTENTAKVKQPGGVQKDEAATILKKEDTKPDSVTSIEKENDSVPDNTRVTDDQLPGKKGTLDKPDIAETDTPSVTDEVTRKQKEDSQIATQAVNSKLSDDGKLSASKISDDTAETSSNPLSSEHTKHNTDSHDDQNSDKVVKEDSTLTSMQDQDASGTIHGDASSVSKNDTEGKRKVKKAETASDSLVNTNEAENNETSVDKPIEKETKKTEMASDGVADTKEVKNKETSVNKPIEKDTAKPQKTEDVPEGEKRQEPQKVDDTSTKSIKKHKEISEERNKASIPTEKVNKAVGNDQEAVKEKQMKVPENKKEQTSKSTAKVKETQEKGKSESKDDITKEQEVKKEEVKKKAAKVTGDQEKIPQKTEEKPKPVEKKEMEEQKAKKGVETTAEKKAVPKQEEPLQKPIKYPSNGQKEPKGQYNLKR